MATTNALELVECALNNDDDELLRQIYLSIKIQTFAILSDWELRREFDVEAYIPKYAKDRKKLKPCIAFRRLCK